MDADIDDRLAGNGEGVISCFCSFHSLNLCVMPGCRVDVAACNYTRGSGFLPSYSSPALLLLLLLLLTLPLTQQVRPGNKVKN